MPAPRPGSIACLPAGWFYRPVNWDGHGRGAATVPRGFGLSGDSRAPAWPDWLRSQPTRAFPTG